MITRGGNQGPFNSRVEIQLDHDIAILGFIRISISLALKKKKLQAVHIFMLKYINWFNLSFTICQKIYCNSDLR